MRTSHVAVLALALAGLLTTSCSAEQETSGAVAPSSAGPTASPSLPSPSPSPAPTSAGATMRISSFEYVLPASVRSGERVTVVNEDREAHTVTVDRGAIRLPVLPGATAVFTAPADAGPHPVTCDLHGGMEAVLVVA